MPKGGKKKVKSEMAAGDRSGKRARKKSGKKSGSCLPKKKCCVSKDKCKRCPLLALKRGTLPEGYTVKKRKLVKIGKSLPDAA